MRPCPFCEEPLQEWRFYNLEVLGLGSDPDYIDCCVVNNPDIPVEHALYHIPESC